ncbi:hypothetical protein GCM10027074_59110 [Streptomyces deserti]
MSSRSSNALVVPVEVAALAVNTRTQSTDGTFVFHRWHADFTLTTGHSMPPEPQPFQIDEWPGTAERRGVYVQWQLPEALTRGRHDPERGVEDFPLVPNRWLVVRHQAASKAVRAWIVESDHLGMTTGTVSYLDPHAGTPTATKIGRRHALTPDTPWREPEDAPTPFLTALGPGLLTFSVFQPYNENVFSLHDTLGDVTGADRLSYHVTGWYTDEDSDILTRRRPGGSLADLLDELEWLAPAATSNTRRSLYTGSVLGIDWQPDGPVPPSDVPDPDAVAVAIGNSTAEAMSGLVEEAAGPGSLSRDESRLVKAFALGTLDTLDRTDGDELTEEAAHRSGFGPAPAGYTWHLADHTERSDDDAPSQSAAERFAEEQVLAELNRAQAELDAAEQDLAAAQQYLYVLWALAQAERLPPDFEGRIEDELDPAYPDGAAGRTDALSKHVADLRRQVPWATTPEELEEKAATYATDQELRTGRVLKRVPKAPHENPADPVLLLQGTHLHAPMTRGSHLPCRTPDRLVTAVGSLTAASVTAEVNKVNTAAPLPAETRALLTEFFLLDRARHEDIDLGGATGALPEYGTEPWRQPWQPLFLQWAVDYTAITYRDDTEEHWAFDGHRYRWQGRGPTSDPFVITGRQILAPTAGHDLDGKLAAHAAGRTDLPDLTALREDTRNLDVLSQRLDGLSAYLDQRDPRATLTPTGPLTGLIEHADQYPPRPGTVSFTWPGRPPEVTSSPFYELRAGQLAFTQLAVVDRFGRAVNLVEPDSARHFKPCRPTSMIPDHPVESSDTHRFVELSPRLLQPGRLGFDFLDATADEDTDLTPGGNPVCSWILPNRLDKTLAVYDPAGHPWGELRTVMGTDSNKQVVWAPLPGSPITTLAQLEQASPHTHRLLAAIAAGGPARFDAVRATIDDALTTIDPDGADDESLAFLLGRPLALVRARLDLQMCGPARTSIGWNEVLDPENHPAQLPAWDWTVRLGQTTNTQDGLLAYVLNEEYTHLETITEPTGNHGGYLRPIGTGDRFKLAFEGTSTATVTLLTDPRAAVHATTDILPVSSVHVPQQYTAQALARMAVCFRTGPLLAPTTPDPRTAVMPHPATATGTWTWTEPTGTTGAWRTLPVTVPDPGDLPLGDPEIRSGFLVLNDAADATR